MAVAFTSSGSFNSAATTTTATFNAPATVTAGDVWICSLQARGGTGNTFGTLPSGFTQIMHLDSGTIITLGVFWYTALGTETANSSFATMSVGSTARWPVTTTAAFSGVNGAGIVVPQVGTAATTALSSDTTAAATGASDGVYFATAGNGNIVTSAGTFSSNLTQVIFNPILSTGSAVTNATIGAMAAGFGAFASGATFSLTYSGSLTSVAVAVPLPAASAPSIPVPEPLPFNPVARRRSSNW